MPKNKPAGGHQGSPAGTTVKAACERSQRSLRYSSLQLLSDVTDHLPYDGLGNPERSS